jgi:adhesin/invasin
MALLGSSLACDKVPLLAPTGSVITLFASTTNVPLNGSIEIVATVIENGTASTPGTGTGNTGSTSTSGAGTPVHNGTVITFTTTIGHIEPSEARTNNGEVRVRLITGTTSGAATILAHSGGASAKLENLLVGSAAAKRITVSASPQSLPSSGGTSTVSARVEDDGGTGLPGVPVTFTTTAGTVNPTSTTTNDLGVATTQLSSTLNADVTATAGAQTGKVTVAVRARVDIGVTASPNPTSTGVPTIFSVTAGGTGINVVSSVIEFGDGGSQSLGPLSSGARSVAHVYSAFGTYTATVTATDANGERTTGGATVIVGSLSVSITASNSTVGLPVTFTASVPATVPVARFQWTYDDGTTQTTTANTTQRVFESRGTKTIRVDVIGIDGSVIGTATAQINIA